MKINETKTENKSNNAKINYKLKKAEIVHTIINARGIALNKVDFLRVAIKR